MHFIVNSKSLLKAVKFAGKNVPNNSGTPIFMCILFEVKNSGKLLVTGNDGNIAISTRIDMVEQDTEGLESFKLAIPADVLVKFLSSLPTTPITITYNQEGEFLFFVEIAFGSNIFKISCEDPTTFLKMPAMPDPETVTLPGAAVQRGLSQVVHCTSADTLRPALCGVNMVVQNGLAVFTATDGHVAGNYSIEIEDSNVNLNMLLPARFAGILADFLEEGYEQVELRVSKKFVRAHAGDWAAYGVKIEDRFPADFIPTDFKYKAVINAEEFKTVIKRASIFEDNSTSLIVFNFRDNNLFVRVDDSKKNAAADQDMQIESEIEDFRLAFNRKNLERVLSTVSGDFTLWMNASNMPAVFEPAADEGERTRYLLMPSMAPAEYSKYMQEKAAAEAEA